MSQTIDANDRHPFPPLPPLHDPTQEEEPARKARQLAAPTGQNPWSVRILRIPIDASVVRPVSAIRTVKPFHRNIQLTGVSGRSPFRRGEMTLDRDGFTLTGVCVRPAGWPRIVGYIGAGIWLAALATWAVPVPDSSHLFFDGMRTTASIAGFSVAVLSGFLDAVLTEIRRIPAEIRVAWDDVNEIQFASTMRWAVLVYTEPPSKRVRRRPILALPLNALEPAVIHALQETAEAFIPGKCRPNADVYAWTPLRRTVAAVVIGVLFAGFFILYAATH